MSDALRCIEAEVTFIPENEGGRKQLPSLSDCVYKPHIVVGDPTQRKAIIGDGNTILESYVGVAFLSSEEDAVFNVPFIAELVLMYDGVENESETVVAGATFTIREAGHVVGFGKVKRLFTK